MKDWIKKKLEMAPQRRLSIGYWVGTLQAILMMTFLQMSKDGELTVMHWVIFLLSWIVIGFIYIRNVSAFQKETLWMTIKNPAKVTAEQDDAERYYSYGSVASSAGKATRPNRPPPPPRPPAPRDVTGRKRT